MRGTITQDRNSRYAAYHRSWILEKLILSCVWPEEGDYTETESFHDVKVN